MTKELKQQQKRNNNIKWYYINDADITIGETPQSRAAKLILIILLYSIVIVSILSYFFKDYVYDYIVNPGLTIPSNEITLEVFDKFEPEKYVIPDNDNIIIEYPKNISTKKTGQFEIIYTSANTMHVNEYVLTLNVIDKTAPTIVLSNDLVILTRGVDTNKFDAKAYLVEYYDNYDKRDKIKFDYTKNLNFNSNDTLEVIYSATDSSNNKGTATLKIVVNNDIKETLRMEAELRHQQYLKEQEEQAALIAQQQNEVSTTTNTTTSNQNTNNTNNTSQNTGSSTLNQNDSGDTSNGSNNNTNTNTPSTPYIHGVHDVTIQAGTDIETLTKMLITGVTGSGYISCDYSSVDLRVPGHYIVTFSSSDGITETANVYVE